MSLLAGALAELGVSKGDRVLVYMPMIPEAIFAMLATARLGAVHSVVFGGKYLRVWVITTQLWDWIILPRLQLQYNYKYTPFINY